MDNGFDSVKNLGMVLSVLRSKGGAHEELSLNRLCDKLYSENLKFIIVCLKLNSSFNPRTVGRSLIKFQRSELKDANEYLIPYEQVTNFEDAEKKNHCYINLDWSIWNKNFIEALKKTLPEHRIILTIGERSAARLDEVEAAISMSEQIFITLSNHDRSSLLQIERCFKYLKIDDRAKMFIASWTESYPCNAYSITSATDFLSESVLLNPD